MHRTLICLSIYHSAHWQISTVAMATENLFRAILFSPHTDIMYVHVSICVYMYVSNSMYVRVCIEWHYAYWNPLLQITNFLFASWASSKVPCNKNRLLFSGCSDGGCCFHLSKPPPSLHQWLLGQWWGLYHTSAVMLRLRPSEALPEGLSWEPDSDRNGSNATATFCSSILKAFICCCICSCPCILSFWVHCVLDQWAGSVCWISVHCLYLT